MTPTGDAGSPDPRETDQARSLRDAHKQHIERILKEVQYDREQAAILLDISLGELVSLMRQLGLEQELR